MFFLFDDINLCSLCVYLLFEGMMQRGSFPQFQHSNHVSMICISSLVVLISGLNFIYTLSTLTIVSKTYNLT